MLDRWGLWTTKKTPLKRVQIELAHATALRLDGEVRHRNRPLNRVRSLKARRIPKSEVVRQILRDAALHRWFPATAHYLPADVRLKFRIQPGVVTELEDMRAEINKRARLGNILISKQKFFGAILLAGLERLDKGRQENRTVVRKFGVRDRPATVTAPGSVRESVVLQREYHQMLAEEQERVDHAQEFYTKAAQWERAQEKGTVAMVACRMGWWLSEARNDASQWLGRRA